MTPIEEGKVRRGGLHGEPKTEKPNMVPMSQCSKYRVESRWLKRDREIEKIKSYSPPFKELGEAISNDLRNGYGIELRPPDRAFILQMFETVFLSGGLNKREWEKKDAEIERLKALSKEVTEISSNRAFKISELSSLLRQVVGGVELFIGIVPLDNLAKASAGYKQLVELISLPALQPWRGKP